MNSSPHFELPDAQQGPLDQVVEVIEELDAAVIDWLNIFAYRLSVVAGQVEDLVTTYPLEGERSDTEQHDCDNLSAWLEQLNTLCSDANLACEEVSARFVELRGMCTRFEIASVDSQGVCQVDAELPGDAARFARQAFAAQPAVFQSPEHEEFASAFSTNLGDTAAELRRLSACALDFLEAFPATDSEHDVSLPALSDLCDSCPAVALPDQPSQD